MNEEESAIKSYQLRLAEAEQTIADLKKTEKRLRRSRDLLMTRIAHDVNNMCHCVLMSTELLERADVSINKEERIKAIRVSVNRIIDQMQNFQTKASLSTGKANICVEKIQMNQFLDNLRTHHQSHADSQQVRLFVFPLFEPVFIKADKQKLRRILDNLVGNAIKFTPQNGIVAVRFHQDPDSGEAIFSVKDTGRGIPDDAHSRIFQTFQQVSPLDRNEGFGLGLSIVIDLIRLLEGKIDLKTKEGKGTTFTISIPQ